MVDIPRADFAIDDVHEEVGARVCAVCVASLSRRARSRRQALVFASAERKNARGKMRLRVSLLLTFGDGCALNGRTLPLSIFSANCHVECRFWRDMRRGVLLACFSESSAAGKQGMIDFVSYLYKAIQTHRMIPARTLHMLNHPDVHTLLQMPVCEADWALVTSMLARVRLDPATVVPVSSCLCKFVDGERRCRCRVVVVARARLSAPSRTVRMIQVDGVECMEWIDPTAPPAVHYASDSSEDPYVPNEVPGYAQYLSTMGKKVIPVNVVGAQPTGAYPSDPLGPDPLTRMPSPGGAQFNTLHAGSTPRHASGGASALSPPPSLGSLPSDPWAAVAPPPLPAAGATLSENIAVFLGGDPGASAGPAFPANPKTVDKKKATLAAMGKTGGSKRPIDLI